MLGVILCGLDPDLNGGIAVVDIARKEIVRLDRMPTFEPPVKGNRYLDIPAAWATIQKARYEYGAKAAVLESPLVMAQKGKGGKGSAMMGSIHRVHQTYGALRALCELTFTRPGIIHAWPSVWKRDMDLSSDKEVSRKLAAQLYPSHASLLSKVKNTGLAEAILLTEWGKEKCT